MAFWSIPCQAFDSVFDTRPRRPGSDSPGADDTPGEPDPQDRREREADRGEEVDAPDLRAAVGEEADQAGADEAADDDDREHEPVEDEVEPVEELVQALVAEADLDLPVADLLERVVYLVRKLEEHA